ncbi:hypothetical protein K3179_01940 [Qipengyuania sp. GH38]|uniref:hypothetical protein n=1 Tax=Qipengyuania intermedia TaxID=2867244 RepID=UPI001C8829D2|nr:hypothetical protein [Qipengyuania intermedia]MBX7513302.1 hypothetical protein [Qipengyuania intermedia]
MDLFELRHVATVFGVAAIMIGWNLISRRLPGHYGKAVDGAVEIVPTVGMWLSAVLMPIGSLALLALGAVVLYGLPEYRSPIVIVAMLMWACSFAFGLSSIAKIIAVRRHRIRYDSFGLSYIPSRGGKRTYLAFDDVDRVEIRWLGADRIRSGEIAIPFAEDAGGSRQLASLLDQRLLSREMDRA